MIIDNYEFIPGWTRPTLVPKYAEQFAVEVINTQLLRSEEEQYPTPDAKLAREVYARSDPKKHLVKADDITKARLNAFAYDYEGRNLTEEEIRAFAEAELEASPLEECFPWMHFSKAAQAYFLGQDDLVRIFKADLTHHYPDRIEGDE